MVSYMAVIVVYGIIRVSIYIYARTYIYYTIYSLQYIAYMYALYIRSPPGNTYI